MRTAEEILRYIETFYRVALEEPKSFFRDAAQMECELSSFERCMSLSLMIHAKYSSIQAALPNSCSKMITARWVFTLANYMTMKENQSSGRL
jgi:hypothetical protein